MIELLKTQHRKIVLMNKVTKIFLLLFVLGLTACGSNPSHKSKASIYFNKHHKQSSSGGYYLDDGPGDHIPEGLDQVPDAVPKVEPFSPWSLRPYTALGSKFYPKQDIPDTPQIGIASWYGKRFHSGKTAIGESYNMFSMTAAHPTLPLPSYARVVNLENGRSVVVRVNDRGPFLRGRIIDLSYAAAYRLGYVNKGSARVKVQPITPEMIAQGSWRTPSHTLIAANNQKEEDNKVSDSELYTNTLVQSVSAEDAIANFARLGMEQEEKTQDSAMDKHAIYLQMASFRVQRNAEDLLKTIGEKLEALKPMVSFVNFNGMVHVRVGPFKNEQAAKQQADTIYSVLNIRPFVVNNSF